ncbi:alpha/beta hydrolase fold domain-containing protein [Novosphingobium sp. BL-52-GroH]|uniref:alpha/beta hydrolase fold domain-containing protein n=1 Tax=Novosphingobium sp. BL-52-GroH TaxID=3349877 RepID=UPI00384D068B
MTLLKHLARVVLLILAGAAIGGVAQAEPTTVDYALTPRPPETYPPLTFTLEGGVRGIADLTYATQYGYRPLRLDLYLPPKDRPVPKTGRPVIVYVHGGGWVIGNKRQADFHGHFLQTMAALARRGYVVASIEHRLREEAPFPAATQDAKSAIMWLRKNAATYDIDANRFAIWGGSSGGNITGNVAVSCGVKALDPVFTAYVPKGATPPQNPLAGYSNCVQAAVAWYGVFDFNTLKAQAIPGGDANFDEPTSAASRYLGCAVQECPADKLALANSHALVDAKDPPMLLIHGTGDTNIPFGQSVEMDKALREAGVSSKLVLIPNSLHGFRAASDAQAGLDMQQALAETFAFFDRTIGRGGR